MDVVVESTHYDRHKLLVEVDTLEFVLNKHTYQLKYPLNGIFIDKELQVIIVDNCRKIKKNTEEMLICEEYNNAEGVFKGRIRERLNNLLENCDKIEDCAKELKELRISKLEEKLEIHRYN